MSIISKKGFSGVRYWFKRGVGWECVVPEVRVGAYVGQGFVKLCLSFPLFLVLYA